MSEQVNVPNYVTIVRLDQTTDEGYCYIAYHPELPNTISQGETPEEATEELIEATQMTIEYLISKGLSVPQPSNLQSVFWNGSEVQHGSVKSVSATPKASRKNNSQRTLAASGLMTPA